MATFTERLSIAIDVITDGAKKGISDFRAKVADADGTTAKFKAGATSALKTVADHAGALAITGGAALAVFGAKALGAFEDTAKAALDLSHATGLSTEEASRWIAISDDYGVSAEDLAKAIGKIDKAIDSNKWAKYGIDTHDAQGNVKSANDLFLSALDVMNATPDATARAAVGYDLFGKGFATLAPLVGKSRGEYEKLLSTVKDGEVITNDEAARAEKSRLAQVELGKAVHSLSLSFGELLADGTPVLQFITYLIDKVSKLEQLAFQDKPIDKPIKAYGDAILAAGDNIDGALTPFQNLMNTVKDSRSVVNTAGDGWKAFGRSITGMSTDHELAFANLKRSFTDLAQSSPDAADKVLTALSNVYAQMQTGNKAAKDFWENAGLSRDRLAELGTVLDSGTSPAVQNFSSMAGEAAREGQKYTTSLGDMKKAADESAQALKDLNKATDDIYQGEYDKVKAQEDYAASIQGIQDALSGKGGTSLKDAVHEAADKFAELNGQVSDSKEGTATKLQWIKDMESLTKKGSPTWNALEDMRLQLEAIKTAADIKVTADVVGLNPQAQNAVNNYTANFIVSQKLTEQEVINLIVAWQRRNGQIPRF